MCGSLTCVTPRKWCHFMHAAQSNVPICLPACLPVSCCPLRVVMHTESAHNICCGQLQVRAAMGHSTGMHMLSCIQQQCISFPESPSQHPYPAGVGKTLGSHLDDNGFSPEMVLQEHQQQVPVSSHEVIRHTSMRLFWVRAAGQRQELPWSQFWAAFPSSLHASESTAFMQQAVTFIDNRLVSWLSLAQDQVL